MYKEILSSMDNFLSVEPNNQQKIQQIREYLGGEIPPSFEQYLVEIGYGGIPAFDIHGTGAKPNEAAFISTNEKYHSTDSLLPKNYFVVMDIGDECIWCLESAQINEEGEMKVVGWISGLPSKDQPQWLKEQESFETFFEFFKAKVPKH